PPAAAPRAVEVRHRPHRPRHPRSADREISAELLDEAAPDFRIDWRGDGRHRGRHHRLARVRPPGRRRLAPSAHAALAAWRPPYLHRLSTHDARPARGNASADL